VDEVEQLDRAGVNPPPEDILHVEVSPSGAVSLGHGSRESTPSPDEDGNLPLLTAEGILSLRLFASLRLCASALNSPLLLIPHSLTPLAAAGEAHPYAHEGGRRELVRHRLPEPRLSSLDDRRRGADQHVPARDRGGGAARRRGARRRRRHGHPGD